LAEVLARAAANSLDEKYAGHVVKAIEGVFGAPFEIDGEENERYRQRRRGYFPARFVGCGNADQDC